VRPDSVGRRMIARVLLLSALFVVSSGVGLVVVAARTLPPVEGLATLQPASATRIYARDGSLLASVYVENRVWVPLSKIPPVVREAFIADEDRNFYTDPGIDPLGILRAAWADLRGQPLEGASTITQQLARNLFLNDSFSIVRKIQEAMLALEITRRYSKGQILEDYLNLIYLGAGSYGVDAAAHTYFGRSIAHVDLQQAAMLAGINAAPSVYCPYVDYRLAREREKHVLERMAAQGYITERQAEAAYRAPLGLQPERSGGVLGYRDPWFTTYVVARLNDTFGAQAVERGGLQVYTTVDPRLERIAQQAVDWGVRTARAEGIGAHQAALVALQPQTGDILAMVGGTDFSLHNQFNRAWQALRQPGSSFKVYLYTAAMDRGLLPSTVMDDTPVTYATGDGKTWSPMDDDHRFWGPITLRRALAYSRNVVAVKLAERVGVDTLIDTAHAMGVRAPLQPNLSLALGTSGVSVLDQADGYATLANGGYRVRPTAIRLVRDAFGNTVVDDRTPQRTRVLPAGIAYLVTSMLEDVIAYGTGVNAQIGRPAAGKTGTTSDFRDAWFVGYTPDLVAAVWVGNDDYTPMRESYGGNIPARIWARFMRAALQDLPPHAFPVPYDVVRLPACAGGDLALKSEVPLDPCAGASPAPAAKRRSGAGAPDGVETTPAEGDVPVDTGTPPSGDGGNGR